MEKAENTVSLCNIVPYKWDEVRIYRRPMDTQYETPDYNAIYQHDNKFTIDDGVSLLVFYDNHQVVGCEIYPSYRANTPQLFYSDGNRLIEYAQLTCEQACFDIIRSNVGVQWVLKMLDRHRSNIFNAR